MFETQFDVTIFNYVTFIVLYNDFGKMDQKSLTRENDIRVQNLGGNKYAAEFWEHGKQEPSAVEPDHSVLRFQDQIPLLHLPFNC